MDSLVSIIVPVYNSEEYLSYCVNTLLKQTYCNIEIILIDDGSTDKSGEICDLLSKSDERIIVVHQDNKGVSASRNTGISIASGRWIMFVDSDDWLEDDAISSIIKYEDSGMDILAFNLQKTTDRKKSVCCKTRTYNIKQYRNYLIGSCLIDTERFASLFPKEMKHGPKMVYPVAKLYKTEVIKKNNI